MMEESKAIPGDRKVKKEETTNVMRILTQRGVDFKVHNYTESGVVAGLDTAAVLGEDPGEVCKTLVTVGRSGTHYVFLVPVERELHLKKAAAAVGEKSVEMIKSRDLLPLTGYVHGGCSPIGMKKPFRTVIDLSAAAGERIYFSAGKIGYQIETTPEELRKALIYETADVTGGKAESDDCP